MTAQGDQNTHLQVQRPAPTTETSPNPCRVHHLGILILNLRPRVSTWMRGASEGSVRGSPHPSPEETQNYSDLLIPHPSTGIGVSAGGTEPHQLPSRLSKDPFSLDIQQPLAIHESEIRSVVSASL